MYYEVYGEGKPLVLIHGGGSTIQTSFGRIIPLLAKQRQVIAADMQTHGRTGDREAFLSFEQDADDVATLLKSLGIDKADILGFSNGGHTAIEMAIRHPGMVNKLVLCSTFYKLSAAAPQFWEGFKEGNIQFSDMPQTYKDEFLKANNDPKALLNMFNKDVQRMRVFKDWTDEQIRSIKTPVFILNADNDVGSPEHAVEMFRTFPYSQLAIFPGGHGRYLGEMVAAGENDKDYYFTSEMIGKFLDN
jgi:pimeloyl-ACP methyl ester carboxylesterase